MKTCVSKKISALMLLATICMSQSLWAQQSQQQDGAQNNNNNQQQQQAPQQQAPQQGDQTQNNQGQVNQQQQPQQQQQASQDALVQVLLNGIRADRQSGAQRLTSSIINDSDLSQLAVCSSEVNRGTSYGALLSVNARTGSTNACTAAQAQAITSTLGANRCALVVAAADSAVDVDLLVTLGNSQAEDLRVPSDTNGTSYATVVVCNREATAQVMNIQGRAYDNAGGNQAIVIARHEFAAPSVQTVALDTQSVAAVSRIVQDLQQNRMSNAINTSMFDLRQVNAQNVAACGITTRASADVDNGWFDLGTVSARTGQNACTTDQANAITSQLAANRCALIIVSGPAGNDIDLMAIAGSNRPVGDISSSNQALAVACNRSNAAVNLTIMTRVYREDGSDNSAQAVISRIDIAAPSNDTVARTALLEHVDTYVRRGLGQSISNLNNNTAPVCTARFASGEMQALQTSARTGANACSAQQAAAISGNLAAGMCTMIIATSADTSEDINLRAQITGDREHADRARDNWPVLTLCNSGTSAAAINLQGQAVGSAAVDAAILRYDFAAPRREQQQQQQQNTQTQSNGSSAVNRNTNTNNNTSGTSSNNSSTNRR